MEPGQRQEFPPVTFSTFKAPSMEKDEPPSPTSRQYGESSKKTWSAPTELSLQNKNTPPIRVQNTEMQIKLAGALKEETRLWFHNTQRDKLIKNRDYPPWFHGFLTRRRAEEILQEKPLGCFLIRFCESRVGYVLSYRGGERCRHFMLDQQKDGLYLIEGETSTHHHLEDLLDHYHTHPVEPYKELLTKACVKMESQTEALKEDPKYGKVTKTCTDHKQKTLTQATSPTERKKTIPKDVHGAPPFLQNAMVACVQKQGYETGEVACVTEPGECTVTEQSSAAYSAESKEDSDQKQPRKKEYCTTEELHTFSKPNACMSRGMNKGAEVEDPIAFYAIGRGSTKVSSENIYSEVDANSRMASDPKTKTYKQGTSATLHHSVNRAPCKKTTAFHSSLRINKRSGMITNMYTAQDSRGQAASNPKDKMIQFDDPAYSNSSGYPHPMEAESLENIYERIPDPQRDNKNKKQLIGQTQCSLAGKEELRQHCD